MTSANPQTTVTIRLFQYRDLDEIERLLNEESDRQGGSGEQLQQEAQQLRQRYGLLKMLSMFPNPLQHSFCAYVAELNGQLCGLIQVSPFNQTRSTWRVDRVLVGRVQLASGSLSLDVGTQLLRHCFQTIWEARTWIIEANVNDKETLALYRHNGFQQLARMTYWAIAPEILPLLADREPDLPNLLPVSNADASLLHQLDTASMPPLVRQVFDRHVVDFKSSVFRKIRQGLKPQFKPTESFSAYVFEPQRKAAIGYFQLHACRNGSQPHRAELTVHPAYTWLYPELMAQMARQLKHLPPQELRLASSDYQSEREAYLEQIGATRVEHTLMMSRSVWHKLRESKFALDGLALSEVLQGFQQPRKPIPGRFSPSGEASNRMDLNGVDLNRMDLNRIDRNRTDRKPGQPDRSKD
jgi:hypothetical protein